MGSEWNITALITLKIAVLAPMPSASVATAMAVNAGDFASRRNPYRASCRSVVTLSKSLIVPPPSSYAIFWIGKRLAFLSSARLLLVRWGLEADVRHSRFNVYAPRGDFPED